MQVRNFVLLSILMLTGVTALLAQANAQDASRPEEPAAVVSRNFGGDLAPVAKYPVLKGDLDGDGNEDIVIVVQGKNPLTNEAAGKYKVLDPYNAYWGWGDPKMTMSFINLENGPAKYLAVVHGWKLPAPVAKFILVNVPFESLSMGSFKVKKKTVSAIVAEEAGGITAAVFFDGKKYKWEAFGSN